MGATLEALQALREIELQIADIRRQLAAKERSVTRQSEKFRAAEESLEAVRGDLRHTQIAADAADLDVKSRDAVVNRLRDNLNTVRTNKEYAAILSQLNNEKADRSRTESKALELMQEVENRRKQVAECEAIVQEEARRLETLKAQLAQAQESFRRRQLTLEQERAAAAERIDAKTIEHFNRISERYDGEAMARVVQVHPRRMEYICEGCNMSVTIERANALMTRDEVQTCGSCGRILYIDKKR
jgi:hypothetical protein